MIFQKVYLPLILSWDFVLSFSSLKIPNCPHRPRNPLLFFQHMAHPVCPMGLHFPAITSMSQLPSHIKNYIMLQSKDYAKEGISPADTHRARVLVKMLQKDGWVYLVNHSIPEDSLKAVFEQSRLFFRLPRQDKNDFFHLADTNFKPNESTPRADRVSIPIELKETFEFTQDTVSRPSVPLPHFFPALDWFKSASVQVVTEVLQLIALALDFGDPNTFANLTQGLYNSSVRTMSRLSSFLYTGLKKGDTLPGNTVFTPHHTDFGLISLIYQDQVGGLEVMNMMGAAQWVRVDPVPGSIILIAANIMRIISGGQIVPVLHRPVPPFTNQLSDGSYKMNRNMPERQSIIHFISSDDEACVKPLMSPLTAKQYFVNLIKARGLSI